MQKEIFINESMGETRIAIQESNQLVEVYVEKQDNHRMVGNVYKGVVENVLPGMQAAFVDIGYELNAFLPFSEIGSDEFIVEENDDKKSKNNKNSKLNTDRLIKLPLAIIILFRIFISICYTSNIRSV